MAKAVKRTAVIEEKVVLAEGIISMWLKQEEITKNAKAGQFIIFRVEENGERVPSTIADVNKETGALTIVFMAVG